jgi:hypothetical protein
MPEPTTRDEHVARAQELAAEAYAYHVDLKNAAKILQDPERMISAQRVAELNQMAAASVARMHALAELATANVQIAEVLGQQPVAEVPHDHGKYMCGACFLAAVRKQEAQAPADSSLWQPVARDHFGRDGGWELSFTAESETVDGEEHGWRLYGPGCSKSGYWLTYGLAASMVIADRVIEAHHANPGSKKATS